ncbi:MAG: RNA polymerase sigma-70 factor [Elusimicrobia bacterium]|nr:RNA polymerase sigma-70 factor [Elusimicrobiota bacterium]
MEYRKLKDLGLVSLAKQGDRSAFSELVKRYEKKVYALALRIMQNPEDASDVLQDTFIQVFKKIKDFKEKSRFSTWLYRIAYNECLMRKRKKQIPTVSIDEPLVLASGEELKQEIVDWSSNPLATIENKELKNKLEEAISKLPGEYRDVVVLKDIEGLSHKEIADMLKISIPNVKTRLHRARMFLRKELSDYFKGLGFRYGV